jgi:hypothetical protein
MLSGLLSTPNIFIFHLHINGSARYCTAVFNHQSTLTARRIYLTFISLVVYFIPFLVLVLCYILIFVKLLWREHDQEQNYTRSRPSSSSSSSSSSCCSCLLTIQIMTGSKTTFEHGHLRSSSNRSSFSDFDARRKRANTYAKARTKTFRLVNKQPCCSVHISIELVDSFGHCHAEIHRCIHVIDSYCLTMEMHFRSFSAIENEKHTEICFY